jgi:hypothetical protein
LSAQDRANFSAFITIIRVGWGNDNSAFRQIFTNTLMPDGTDGDARVFNEMERSAATGEDAAAFIPANSTIDVTAAASQVRAPTLVIHRRGDRMVPFQFGREMAALIPGARLLAVDGRDHLFVPGDPRNNQIAEVVRHFSMRTGLNKGMERKLAAILCADVFGYSRLMGEDEEATLHTLMPYRRLIDSQIGQHHGRSVIEVTEAGGVGLTLAGGFTVVMRSAA